MVGCSNCGGGGCSYCDPDISYIECPDCEDGYKYYLIDPVSEEWIPCSKKEYDKAVEEYRDRQTCETCNGEGVIYD